MTHGKWSSRGSVDCGTSPYHAASTEALSDPPARAHPRGTSPAASAPSDPARPRYAPASARTSCFADVARRPMRDHPRAGYPPPAGAAATHPSPASPSPGSHPSVAEVRPRLPPPPFPAGDGTLPPCNSRWYTLGSRSRPHVHLSPRHRSLAPRAKIPPRSSRHRRRWGGQKRRAVGGDSGGPSRVCGSRWASRAHRRQCGHCGRRSARVHHQRRLQVARRNHRGVVVRGPRRRAPGSRRGWEGALLGRRRRAVVVPPLAAGGSDELGRPPPPPRGWR